MCDNGHSHDHDVFGFLVDAPEIRAVIDEAHQQNARDADHADRIEALKPAFARLLAANGWLPDAFAKADDQSRRSIAVSLCARRARGRRDARTRSSGLGIGRRIPRGARRDRLSPPRRCERPCSRAARGRQAPGAYTGRREGGHGIAMVERRLALAYGDAARLSLRAVEQSTITEMHMPLAPLTPEAVS